MSSSEDHVIAAADSNIFNGDPDDSTTDSYDDSDEETDMELMGSTDINDRESAEDDSCDSYDESTEDVRMQNTKAKINVPIDIVEEKVMNLDCHPTKNLLAAGLIDGSVKLYSFHRKAGNKCIYSYVHQKHHCRAVKFSELGCHLFTASSDAFIYEIDLESNSIVRNFHRINGLPISTILPIDSHLLASGEEDGEVVLWDIRMQLPIQSFEECSEYISSLSINKVKRNLIATSGDGRLASYNVRARKLDMQSVPLGVELTCSGIFKNDSKVAVAGGKYINIFNFGEFGNISDRFPGHPDVRSMVVLYDDVICTGCENGNIRAIQLFPNRILGLLGQHDNQFSVDALALSYDSTLLVSCTLYHSIKFWDLSNVDNLRKEDVKYTKKKHQQLNKPVNDFCNDL